MSPMPRGLLRSLANAIFDPSGDHARLTSLPESVVRRTTFEPFTVHQIDVEAGLSRSLTNAMRLPSGDQAGCASSWLVVGGESRTEPVLSVSTYTSV